jgi:hypothetical protein
MWSMPEAIELAWEHAYPGREAAERNECMRAIARLLSQYREEAGGQGRSAIKPSARRALPSTMAALNKSLAQINKSQDGGQSD